MSVITNNRCSKKKKKSFTVEFNITIHWIIYTWLNFLFLFEFTQTCKKDCNIFKSCIVIICRCKKLFNNFCKFQQNKKFSVKFLDPLFGLCAHCYRERNKIADSSHELCENRKEEQSEIYLPSNRIKNLFLFCIFKYIT